MLDFFKEAMAATTRGTTETQKAFLAKVQDSESRKRAENVGEVRKTWIATRDQVNALKTAGDDAGAPALVEKKFLPVTDDYIRATQVLVDGEAANVRAAQQEVKDMFQQLYLLGALLWCWPWLLLSSLVGACRAAFPAASMRHVSPHNALAKAT